MNDFFNILNANPGTELIVRPRWFVLTDGTADAVPSLLGESKPADPNRVKVFIDHETPCGSEAHAAKQKALIRFARNSSCQLYNGYGISYQLMLDRHVRAGDIVAHCGDFGSIYGSVGSYALKLSQEEMAQALITGEVKITVPETVHLRLTGSLNYPASAKDAALTALPLLGDTTGKLVMVGGMGLSLMSSSQRTAFFQLLSAGGCNTALVEDVSSSQAKTLDLETVVPVVSGPNDVMKITPAEKLSAIDVSAVFIGGCSAGRIEDIRTAVNVINGRRVQRKVRTTVAFASTEVYIKAANEGLIAKLMDAGVVVMNQGCSGCYAHSQALVDSKDVVLSAGSRECPDCTGAGTVPTLLCSAATAMESAIAGYICPARK